MSVANTTEGALPSRKDRRVERTDRALRRAFESFQGELPLAELSVSAVAERADINRVTFYAHNGSIGELAEDCLRSIFLDAYAAMLPPRVDSGALSEVSRNLLAFIYALQPKRPFLAWLSASAHIMRIEDSLFEAIKAILDSRIEAFRPSCSPTRRRLYVDFQAAGLARLARDYLISGLDSQETAVEDISTLLPELWLPTAYRILGIAEGA